MINYRIAMQTNRNIRMNQDQSSTWQWKSPAFTSLDGVIRFLNYYRAIPQNRLRIFCATSREKLEEMLAHANRDIMSDSFTVEQFLNVNGISNVGVHRTVRVNDASEMHEEYGRRTCTGTLPVPLDAEASSSEPDGQEQNSDVPMEGNLLSEQDVRRLEIEMGAPGNHDDPYTFSLPTSVPQALAWTELLVKVRDGELSL